MHIIIIPSHFLTCCDPAKHGCRRTLGSLWDTMAKQVLFPRPTTKPSCVILHHWSFVSPSHSATVTISLSSLSSSSAAFSSYTFLLVFLRLSFFPGLCIYEGNQSASVLRSVFA